MIGSRDKGRVPPVASITSKSDATTHLLWYWFHRRKTSKSSVVAKGGGEIIPCTSVWSSSSLSMRLRILEKEEKWHPP